MKELNVAALQRNLRGRLRNKFSDQTLCDQYAWWLLEAISNHTKESLIAQAKLVLNTTELELLEDWMENIIDRSKPIQYVLGWTPFLDLKILVEPPTLIPRPETEEMCADLINQLTKLNNQKLTILDIGTGSGCIALALAKALPDAQVYATDIADAALELANRNAEKNKIKNVSFLHSDVFVNIPADLTFDLIVSNPPYIAPKEWDKLDDSVVQWEDRTALVAQNKGLAIIERIVKQAPEFLKENKEMERHKMPQFVLEIGYMQGTAASRLLENAGFSAIKVKKDLEGKDRVVTGRVKHVAVRSEKT